MSVNYDDNYDTFCSASNESSYTAHVKLYEKLYLEYFKDYSKNQLASYIALLDLTQTSRGRQLSVNEETSEFTVVGAANAASYFDRYDCPNFFSSDFIYQLARQEEKIAEEKSKTVDTGTKAAEEILWTDLEEKIVEVTSIKEAIELYELVCKKIELGKSRGETRRYPSDVIGFAFLGLDENDKNKKALEIFEAVIKYY